MAIPIIAVVAFDDISPFHLSVPCVVFGDPQAGGPQFQLKVCAVKPGLLTTTAGFDVAVRHGLAALRTADTIIVPSWNDVTERPPAALLKALVAAHQRGAHIVGLCLGAYVLAEAGLLDGRSATTHWAYAQDFARRYPQVKVDPNVLYVDDGTLMTSAGTAAGIDCCLHLVRRRHGAAASNKIARRLVVAPHRQGGQAQFIEQSVPLSAGGSRLSDLLAWVRAHLQLRHNLDNVAERAVMTRRTFTRQFRKLTGCTFGDWLLAERLALTQQLLESSDHPVEHIVDLAGFGSPASLRLHFRARFGVSPSAWRQTFRS
jgi:transcriptional regulator GlxA family with amidase domain